MTAFERLRKMGIGFRSRMRARPLLLVMLAALATTVGVAWLALEQGGQGRSRLKGSIDQRELNNRLRGLHEKRERENGRPPGNEEAWIIKEDKSRSPAGMPRELRLRGNRTVHVMLDDRELEVPVEEAQRRVREATLFAWNSYTKYAWGSDELAPVSKQGRESFSVCLGLTIIDSADTLYLMELMDEYRDARNWIASLDIECVDSYVNTFEVTIRIFGGFTSLYDLTGDEIYLQQAERLGAKLKNSVIRKNRYEVPSTWCELSSGRCRPDESNTIAVSGSIQMEWRALSYHTREPELLHAARVAQAVTMRIMNASPDDQMTSVAFSVLQGFGKNLNAQKDRTGGALAAMEKLIGSGSKYVSSGSVRIGAEGDSYFEYLLKMYIQGGASPQELYYFREYERQVDMLIQNHQNQKWPHYLSDRPNGVQEHLACFFPGTIALALIRFGHMLSEEKRALWEDRAAGMTEACYLMYRVTKNGLSGETAWLNQGRMATSGGNKLRPEACEAIFYMYRLTKDPKYRVWNWNIFKAIDAHSRVDGGFSGLKNVNADEDLHDDRMETFLLAETFKYLWLTFSEDSVLSLDEWVFNTEAHPLRIRKEIPLIASGYLFSRSLGLAASARELPVLATIVTSPNTYSYVHISRGIAVGWRRPTGVTPPHPRPNDASMRELLKMAAR